MATKAKKTKAKATAKNTKPNKCIIAVVILAAIVLIASIIAAAIIVNTKKQPSVVGTYNFVATINENGEEDTSTADMFKLFGAKYIAEFKEDKTGSLKAELDGSGLSSLMSENSDLGELSTTVNFTYDNGTLTATSDEGETSNATYTYKDGVVTIVMGTETMKFTRAE